MSAAKEYVRPAERPRAKFEVSEKDEEKLDWYLSSFYAEGA
mgnify:CR=1 FL=1